MDDKHDSFWTFLWGGIMFHVRLGTPSWILIGVMIVTAVIVSHASATIIDFQTFPDGSPVPITIFQNGGGLGPQVDKQYEPLGVDFSCNCFIGEQPLFVQDPGSSNIYISTEGRNLLPNAVFDVVASFTNPVLSVSADVLPAEGEVITMNAFDARQVIVAHVTSASTTRSFTTLSLSSNTPISSIQWISTDPTRATVGVDNLRFSVLTPEPSSASLAILGSWLVMGLSRYRKYLIDALRR